MVAPRGVGVGVFLFYSFTVEKVILEDSGGLNLKVDTCFTTSHYIRMASLSACLTHKLILFDTMSWSTGLLPV
jgi:hypothetical protein